MVTAQKNFKRLMQFLKDQENIEVTTISALMDKFSYQPEDISGKDLERIARKIVSHKQVVYNDVYSPSEVFSALSASLQEYGQKSKIPGKLLRQSPLGPMAMPIETPEITALSLDQVYELAEASQDIIRNRGHLPSGLKLEEKELGLGSLMHLFSTVYLDIRGKNEQLSYELLPFDAYPRAHEEEIIGEVFGYKDWIVHRTDLDMSHLAEMTRLQLWTLKPAIEK